VSRRVWARLDNASNIFLASRSSVDPKVFRISAELDHAVDPQLLQEALDETYGRYRLYHAVLRSGVFWYYLQDSDLRPLVAAEELHTCAPIYRPDRRDLLFRVMHHRQRIILEVFHALSDGTGALWFLSDLVVAYFRLRDPEQPSLLGNASKATDSGVDPGRADSRIASADGVAEPVHELTDDSFGHYFRRRRPRHGLSATGPSADSAMSAATTIAGKARPLHAYGRLGRLRRAWGKKVYRVRGTRTPDNRTRVVELTLSTAQVLALARAEGVSLTIYLTALFFESIRLSSGGLGRARTLAASIPVNLRQFFPSSSPRNFFAIIRVEHTYGTGPDDLGSICRQLKSQFRLKVNPADLEEKLRRFLRFERMPVLRIVPRPLKDVLLRLVAWGSNRGLTVAVSNLGRISMPEAAADSHVRRLLFHVSAIRPQFCAMSHDDLLTISFTSPFTETDHVKEFARQLTAHGIDVTVAAARVTNSELAEAES
jgi:hypothetical protein